MTLNDLERQNRGFYGFFCCDTRLYHSQGGATVLALVTYGIVGNAFRQKRSYSTPGSVSTAMGDCMRVGTAIGFRASREH